MRPEAKNQIAFADVILINKTDLVSDGELREVEARIRGINPYAKLHRTQRSQIALDQVLGRNAFDLDRILDIEPEFLHGDGHDHHEHDHGDGHHHHGGMKHYHDEDMQSMSLKTDKPLNPDKFFPVDPEARRRRRSEHPALQGHPVVQGRSGALRVPGRAHDPGRRSPAALEGRREARQPHGVHRPQSAGGEDPARVLRAAWPDNVAIVVPAKAGTHLSTNPRHDGSPLSRGRQRVHR